MTTVNGALFKSRFNLPTFSTANAEVVLDGTIDTLNIYLKTALSNLSGSEGSKTGTYTSQQTGGIFVLARYVYSDMFLNPAGTNVQVSNQGITYIPSPQVLTIAERVARQLDRATESPAIYVSNDPIPTE